MTSTADDTFRPLFKNDIIQTTDQWRERTLQRLGTISGQWTAWVERDNIPKPPGPRPRAPTKPSTETVMTLLKEQERKKIFNARTQAEPRLKLEDVPLPNDLIIWQVYEDDYAIYQDQIKDYEYKDKLVRETFPEENKRSFQHYLNVYRVHRYRTSNARSREAPSSQNTTHIISSNSLSLNMHISRPPSPQQQSHGRRNNSKAFVKSLKTPSRNT